MSIFSVLTFNLHIITHIMNLYKQMLILFYFLITWGILHDYLCNCINKM